MGNDDRTTVDVEWSAALSLPDFCKKELTFLVTAKGVYLWIYPEEDERIVYVGSTGKQSFRARMEQHVEKILGLKSHFFNTTSGAELYKLLSVEDRSRDLTLRTDLKEPTVFAPFSFERICRTLPDLEYYAERAAKAAEFVHRCRFCLGRLRPDADCRKVEGAIISRLLDLHKLGAAWDGESRKPRCDDTIVGKRPKGPYPSLSHGGEGSALVTRLLLEH